MPNTLTYTEVAALGRIVAEATGSYLIAGERTAFSAILIYRYGRSDGLPYETYVSWIMMDAPGTYRRVMTSANASMAYAAMEPVAPENATNDESPRVVGTIEWTCG